jgi:AcrR family transcriptional regulator
MSTQKTKNRKYELKARAESQDRTRQRIAKAAAELHAEIGPAATTVAEIARRAGVSRLTVYNHFPDDAALYPACSAHWMSLHPLPDFEAAISAEDPRERVIALLRAVYTGWYREWGSMMRNLVRDRRSDPVLDEMMSQRSDAALDHLTSALVEGFAVRGAHAQRLRSIIRLALDFWTWDRLVGEGNSDVHAAELMQTAIDAVATDR